MVVVRSTAATEKEYGGGVGDYIGNNEGVCDGEGGGHHFTTTTTIRTMTRTTAITTRTRTTTNKGF